MYSRAFLFYVKGGLSLDDKARKERNDYMKQWREVNKDKVKAAQERYWQKKAETLKKK
jgi:hypothetical protein